MKEHLSKWLGISEHEPDVRAEVQQVPVANIRANRFQPRSVFDESKLDELSATIRTHGVIQPIVVRRQEGFYELIAGERRWRAAQKLGMDFIPAIVRQMSDAQAASVALIENLQREGLTPIEEAAAYQQLIELHHLTQESLAQRLGKGQSTVANKLRLLNLDEGIQEAIRRRDITERHARAMLALTSEQQAKVLQEVLKRELNVKQTEDLVATLLRRGQPSKKRRVAVTKDVRLALNTIRQSLQMIQKSGLTVESKESELDDFFEFVIRVPKKK